MKDKHFILPLLIVTLGLQVILYAQIHENRTKLKTVEKILGSSTVLAYADGPGHSSALHIIGKWDCHIQVDNTCYIITPDGRLEPTKHE